MSQIILLLCNSCARNASAQRILQFSPSANHLSSSSTAAVDHCHNLCNQLPVMTTGDEYWLLLASEVAIWQWCYISLLLPLTDSWGGDNTAFMSGLQQQYPNVITVIIARSSAITEDRGTHYVSQNLAKCCTAVRKITFERLRVFSPATIKTYAVQH